MTLNIAGPEYDFGQVLYAVLQECEHRRRSLTDPEIGDELQSIALVTSNTMFAPAADRLQLQVIDAKNCDEEGARARDQSLFIERERFRRRPVVQRLLCAGVANDKRNVF